MSLTYQSEASQIDPRATAPGRWPPDVGSHSGGKGPHASHEVGAGTALQIARPALRRPSRRSTGRPPRRWCRRRPQSGTVRRRSPDRSDRSPPRPVCTHRYPAGSGGAPCAQDRSSGAGRDHRRSKAPYKHVEEAVDLIQATAHVRDRGLARRGQARALTNLYGYAADIPREGQRDYLGVEGSGRVADLAERHDRHRPREGHGYGTTAQVDFDPRRSNRTSRSRCRFRRRTGSRS